MYQNVHKHPFSDVRITVSCDVMSCSLWLQGRDSVTHTKRNIYSRFGQGSFLPNPSQFIALDNLPTDFWVSRNVTNCAYCMMLRIQSFQVLRFPYQQHSDTNCIFEQIKLRMCVSEEIRVQSVGFMYRKGKINSSEMAM